ncbi:MAG: hypothetical protein H6754_04025 [Candidatus Omnitrophica bacterium]|nr:hypothetical protein [Candidatus Omnitrophota bacterium]
MNRRISPLLLGACATIFYAFYRSVSPYLVWDDTNWIHINSHATGFLPFTSFSAIFDKYLIQPFAQISQIGYRPFNSVIRLIGSDYFVTPNMLPQIWFMGIAIIEGICAVFIFKLLRRILRTELFALGVLFIFLSSAPVVTSSWIIFAGIQILVPAIICLGLDLYFQIREDKRPQLGLKIALFLTMFFGSFYREFIGVLPLLIIFLEILYQKKITKLLMAAVVSFFHALFPTAMMRIFFHDLPLSPVFKIGLLGERMGGGIDFFLDPFVLLYKSTILINNFYSLIPPLLWMTGLLAGLFLIINEKTRHEIFNKKVIFLCVWFLISFLPFLKIYTEQVHLGYSLLPAILILGIVIERFVLWIRNEGKFKNISLGLLTVILVIIVMDYGANLYGSAKVVYEINRGMNRVAEELKERLPQGSVVVGNALHVGDIQTYSKNYFTAYYSVSAGVPWPQFVVSEKSDLQALAKTQGHDIYFLSMDFDYPLDKVGYHRHKFVYDDNVGKEYLGKIEQTVVEYLYIDPFKRLTARPFISFMGPPDLENDFYRGPCRNGKPFCREVYVEYHLYKYIP